MIVNDPIADMLAHIRNNLRLKKAQTAYVPTQVTLKILNILFHEGFIRGYKYAHNKKNIFILLKYNNGRSVIRTMKRCSTNSKDIFLTVEELQQTQNPFVLTILSTSKGILSSTEAINCNVGGLLLCKIT